MKGIKILLVILTGCLIFCCKKNNKDIPDPKTPLDSIYAITVLPEENIHFVAPAMDGFIKSIYVKNNDSVACGQTIASIYNTEYIDIQKEYLIIRYELEFLREEFKRQGELSIENVTSIKKMQKAQADFMIKEAAYNSLYKKLKIIGFNPEAVYKKGPLTYSYLYAPVNGVIKYHGISPGKYLKKEDELMHIQTSILFTSNYTLTVSILTMLHQSRILNYLLMIKRLLMQ